MTTPAQGNGALTKIIIVGTGGLLLVVIPGLAVVPVVAGLNCAGFGVGGIVSGTAAASAQAAIGNVIAPSLFATLTSAGAGGYGVAALSGAAQTVGGTALGLAGMAGSWLATRH